MARKNDNPYDRGRPNAPVFEPLAAVNASANTITHAAGHKNMQQLIQLRWIAVVGQITTIFATTMVFDVRLPLPAMLNVLACLIAFNIASTLRWQENQVVSNSELLLALTVDIASLTAQLYLSGGATNPFVFLYLLHVILGAVLLEAWSTWTIVGVTGTCIAGLALFSEPLSLPLDHGRGIFSLYVQGMLICFVLDAALLVIFITRIMRNVRVTASKLADLRQRAAEEDHIIRMGLLASGAAHELGTPLATLAVILGDWKHMPEFKANAVLLEEIVEMQTQLKRCKSIVSGILLSAGETRGESSAATTINTFLAELVAEWRVGRPVVAFEFDNRIAPDHPVVSDSTLKQMICNVLDNALEASPQWLRMEASLEEGQLVLQVMDAGPGFAPEILAQLGKPYNSSKGRPGGGLGLFLVVNVARTLGGAVTASNWPQGGALVRLTLPLSEIEIKPESNHYDY
ncbi:ATP-binding protein [Duganella violaceipulchra]|uniref:histidine kinase n=1 Tax=Duganella violaceipulchra TaxID=2849652 RepID=A0AA41HDA3_9BURK|nr:ATP-binding protein [Duganella violaceicalia]MBV6322071.1 sensor histidine kinase [Duganella violaceicalia]MCP2006931.1 two-component system sensor histidine kinase RegB [Duganella violaceicalia]